ncbi:MAG: GTPase ObgE [Bacilli bacterium]|nr:GTPase ObgE [Bacilli bacterium]
MFIDKVKVRIKAGKGGDGMIAFRREKYVDKGGPSGGDGGRGGSVYFTAKSGLTTLLDFKYKRKIIAEDGGKGMGKNCNGKYANDIIINVPIGTIVLDDVSGRIIADFKNNGQTELIAKGGRGGRGNAKFATSVNQVPRIAENGEPGEEIDVTLELKILADAGLVGFPSVGKSTILASVTAAKPEIADYHFTTLSPNIGVVKVKDGRSFVLADLPGLIEGAHNGKGLGLSFLRHIERCRILLHVLDISGSEGRDPLKDFEIINNELENYKMRLMERPMVVIANKMDQDGSQENLERFLKKYKDKYKVFPISALKKSGFDDLLYYIADTLIETPEFSLIDVKEKSRGYIYEYKGDTPGFVIERTGQNQFEIKGERIEKLYKMTNISDDQGFMYLTSTMRKMGIEKALKDKGAKDGDTVNLLDFSFTYYE